MTSIEGLGHVDAWIFDLDNTLYPASANLFAQIDARMTAYVARTLGVPEAEAYATQKRFFLDHGTTLSGLMRHHAVDPHDFLADVHAIELDVIAEDTRLVRLIARLPGRKLVFTNGDHAYAMRVLAKLGLATTFEAIHDIHACRYVPKPDPSAYAGFCAAHGVDPARACFFEDMARNLKPAHAIGMATVWIDNGSEQGHDADRDYVDHRITDLGDFLHDLLGDETWASA